VAKEPWVEIIMVRPIAGTLLGDQTRMKNPRALDFTGRLDGAPVTCRALAADRIFLPKALFAGRAPAALLDTDPSGLLASWIARRYIREAFPNEFERRWRPARRAIRDHLRATGAHLDAIFLRLEERELGPDDVYVVIARGTMLSEDHADPDKRTLAQQALDGAMARLAQCEGIDVEEAILLSEADLSLDDIRLLKRWDSLDDLSFSEEE